MSGPILGLTNLRRYIRIPIFCGGCRKEFEETAARLADLDEIECPTCHALLDVDTEEWRAFRKILKEFQVREHSPPAPIKKG